MACIRHLGTQRHLPSLWVAFTTTSRMAASAAAGFSRTWRRGYSGTSGLPLAILASACPRCTFSEQTPSIARPFAHRASRVGGIVSHLGHATCGPSAERLLHRLSIFRSAMTRCFGNSSIMRKTPPSHQGLCIDHWSWRKSQTYGTIIVDLEQRTVFEILEDRSVETSEMAAPPPRDRSRQQGSLLSLCKGGPPKGVAGLAGRRPVPPCTKSATGHRRTDELAWSRDRPSDFVRCGHQKHRHSRLAHRTGIHDNTCVSRTGAFLQRDRTTDRVQAPERGEVAKIRGATLPVQGDTEADVAVVFRRNPPQCLEKGEQARKAVVSKNSEPSL